MRPELRGIFYCAIALVLTCSCSNRSESSDDSVFIGDKFIIEEDEFGSKAEAAKSGDAAAAYEIYMHLVFDGKSYSLTPSDPDYWLKIAAENGDPRAIHQLSDRE